MNTVVGGHFHLRKRIGAGSFGEVFVGDDVDAHEEVAIKLEPVKTRVSQLLYEAKLYLLLAGGISIPRLHWFGTEANYNVMVIDYLGKSLEDLFQFCHQRLSLKTVLMIADQAIASLEYIHKKSFMHRDVKPDNFLMGNGPRSSQLFVIDFGLSKKYRDPQTHEHLKYAEGKSLTGTARYASVNALQGHEQSRRDDLEALGYCLVYFLKGALPWMGLDARDRKQKYDRICEVKLGTPFEDLCEGQPVEFVMYFRALRELRFTDTPDYALYRQWFRDLFVRNGYVFDYQYDWVNLGRPPRAGPGVAEELLVMSTLAQGSARTPEDEGDFPHPVFDPRTNPMPAEKRLSKPGRKPPSKPHFGGWAKPDDPDLQ
jgi:casein kinase 1 epsilon